MRGTPIITLRLKPMVRLMLEKLARRRETSVSDVIREAIAEYIDRNYVDEE